MWIKWVYTFLLFVEKNLAEFFLMCDFFLFLLLHYSIVFLWSAWIWSFGMMDFKEKKLYHSVAQWFFFCFKFFFCLNLIIVMYQINVSVVSRRDGRFYCKTNNPKWNNDRLLDFDFTYIFISYIQSISIDERMYEMWSKSVFVFRSLTNLFVS